MMDGEVISGGEPCTAEDLPGFISKFKDMGIKVKLDTNGSYPDQLKSLIKSKLLDYIAVDIKTSLGKYGMVTSLEDAGDLVAKSIDLVKRSRIDHEFRTTCCPGIVDKDDIKEIGKHAKGASMYCLQQFRPQITFDPALQAVQPYIRENLEEFRDILLPYVKNVEIRGI
jgi:pyruvate formate lyase activating enzyme